MCKVSFGDDDDEILELDSGNSYTTLNIPKTTDFK